jgi:tRNA pseudouridine55 synthase
MDGLLVIDKPVGPTSHDVVARVRRLLGEQRVGHTGTLDPGASGVLPLVVGRATRLARFLSAAGKSYDAAIQLGVATDTWDSAGTPVGRAFKGPFPDRESIDRALDAFRGTFLQQPPVFSAKKIGGKRSHRLARAASRTLPASLALPASSALPAPPALPASSALPALPASPALPALPAVLPAPVSVTVYALELGGVDGGRLTLRVDCSAGFYVRGLAHDLGERLGVGGHLAALKRVRSGDLTLADAKVLAALELDPRAALAAVVPLAQMLPGLPALTLTHEGARRAAHGLDLGPADFDGGLVACASPGGARVFRLLDTAGDLVGVAEPIEGSGLLHPAVVLV